MRPELSEPAPAECLCTCPTYRHYRGGACTTGGCSCRRLRPAVPYGPPPPPAAASPLPPAPDPVLDLPPNVPAELAAAPALNLPLLDLPPDVLPELNADPAPAATKMCPHCQAEKPVTEFFQRQRGGRAVPQGWCKECQNATRAAAGSTVTVPKLLRNRARHRAVAALVARYQADFEVLYEAAKAEVAAEAAQIAAVPAAAQHYGEQPIRLRPGPRLRSEQITDRIDVGRCPDCARHHDAGHACPACGATPATLQLTLPRTGQPA